MVYPAASPDPVCFTCKIVDRYVVLANDFTQSLSHALLGPMWVVFLSLVSVWVIFQGLRMALLQTSIADYGKELVYVIIAALLLSGQGPDLINVIYTAALKLMGSSASVALQVGNNGASAHTAPDLIGGGMHALVQFAENGVRQVFSMAAAIADTASMYHPLPWIYALVLIVPYFLVLIVYFSQVVISIFRVMMLAALSPYLMLGFAFGWGRGMAVAGIRTLLSSFMILFGATASLSVMLYAVSKLHIGAVGYDPSGLSITDSNYLLALAMGWLGTAFMTEATGIANSISGSVLSNTAIGVITTGITASLLALLAGPKLLAARAVAAGGGLVGASRGGDAVAGHAQRVADLVEKAKKG